VASVGIGGAIRAREVIEVTGTLVPDLLVAAIRDAVARLCTGDRSGSRLSGIGVSVPGTVDLQTGRVGVAPNLGWEDVPLGDMLASAFPDVRTVIDNDANLGVLAEHRRGNGRGCDDVVFMLGRVGVGAGIIMNGVPLRGHDGHAGEIGHNVLDPGGPLCHCGQKGCVETYLGDMALLTRAGRTGEGPLDEQMTQFFVDARRGDDRALGSVRAAAEPLGRTIASLHNTLNLERVVLGGTVGEVVELARPEIESYVARYTLGTAKRQLQLVHPAFGNDSPLLGAAEIAFERLLADPH
jgi:predicted NBD/HSP70 family sugar kinase